MLNSGASNQFETLFQNSKKSILEKISEENHEYKIAMSHLESASNKLNELKPKMDLQTSCSLVMYQKNIKKILDIERRELYLQGCRDCMDFFFMIRGTRKLKAKLHLQNFLSI